MSDPGTLAAERGLKAIEKRIRKIYKGAMEELYRTIASYNLRYMKQDQEMRKKLAEGVITQTEYNQWLKNTVFMGHAWDAKVEHCTEVLNNANRQAMAVIRGEQLDVFAENMTYQAFLLETGTGIDLSFGIYSSQTVSRLLKSQPELLPRKVVDGVKCAAWNKNKIANVITQSIIKGDGIPGIAKSLAETLAKQNDSTMVRYARTAMTSAQNAGRVEMMQEAEDEGIHTLKKWIATLDDRTRDAHAELDGETAEVDEPFENEIGKIMYPGDPTADPANVYNCRCTLGSVIEGVDIKGERRAYKEWDDENGKHHRESYLIEDMTYKEWKEWKEGR